MLLPEAGLQPNTATGVKPSEYAPEVIRSSDMRTPGGPLSALVMLDPQWALQALYGSPLRSAQSPKTPR